MLFFTVLQGQSGAKKILDHPDFLIWNTLQDSRISADGRYVIYRTVPGEGDGKLRIYDALTTITFTLDRVSKAAIDYDGRYVYGLISPHRDSLRNLERRKVNKKEWPCDTLFIALLPMQSITRIPYVKDYTAPEKLGGWLSYTLSDQAFPADTSKTKKKTKKDIVHLIIRQLTTGREDTLRHVLEHVWAEKAPVLVAATGARDSTETAGVACWVEHTWRYIKRQKGEYTKLSLAQPGNQVAFVAHFDTTQLQVKPWELFYYDFKTDSAQSIARKNTSSLPLVSQHSDLRWSEDGKYLYYGRAEIPYIKDTTLLSDEIVDVEVWSTDDPILYTVQNVNKSNEEKRAYTFVYDTQSGQHTGLSSPAWETVVFGIDRNGRYALTYTEKPYLKEATWEGEVRKDLARVDLLTGAVMPFRKGLYTHPRISPAGTYAYGYSVADSTWWVCNLATGTLRWMDRKGRNGFSDEQFDMPSHPHSYGLAGWIQADQSLIVYDRYDLWAWSPEQSADPVALTNGRSRQQIYRYVRTNPEERYLSPTDPWLIHVRDDISKSSGYTWFRPSSMTLDEPITAPYEYSRQVTRARNAESWLFQKENFETFPDLRLSTDAFQTDRQISEVNPQQKDYAWGSIRLYHWKDWQDQMRTGLLVLPPGYDTLRSYPMIVNFYERSSDNLHSHPTPVPHRSTINYAFYASRGYVIFNPDIEYRTEMPGESAYQIVMSGTTSLVRDRIADPENMALQGHSWGGYQIAYIVTRTPMFKCAAAGAAVVNMTSAYGGIRWGTGMARMFQYEKSQSRLGKSLWQDQNIYLQNSPLFKANKIETPLLLMHNDEDAAVPFEQAIEFYLALRRLDKKAWLLNYRGEPHWPVKWHNRKDFQLRMSQFFDHYLMGKPMPEWMAKGVPAVARGIKSGL